MAHITAGYRPMGLQAKCTASQHAPARHLPIVQGQLSVAPYTCCTTCMQTAQQLCKVAHMSCAQAVDRCEGASSF